MKFEGPGKSEPLLSFLPPPSQSLLNLSESEKKATYDQEEDQLYENYLPPPPLEQFMKTVTFADQPIVHK
jgi:hypothetical protein